MQLLRRRVMSAALRAALGSAFLAGWLGFLAVGDWKKREISVRMLLIGAAGGLLWQLSGAAVKAPPPTEACGTLGFLQRLWRYYRAYIGGSVCGAALYLLGRITRGGVGTGDALLTAVLHLWLSTGRLLTVLMGGFLLCGIWGAAGMLVFKKRGKDALPLAPFLWLAVWAALLEGGPG